MVKNSVRDIYHLFENRDVARHLGLGQGGRDVITEDNTPRNHRLFSRSSLRDSGRKAKVFAGMRGQSDLFHRTAAAIEP